MGSVETPEWRALVDAVTHTVLGFVPTGERFQNTVTGRVMDSGTLSFDCGHRYVWRPIGVRDDEPLPAPGQRRMCAHCLDRELGDQP